ncbi:WD40-repeat-containing domain protein [Neocallimastix sp. 'constans']
MKLDFKVFKFVNLCGTFYKQGILVFTTNGNSILSLVEIEFYSISLTLPFENLKNISRIALSPNGILLLSIYESILCNFERRIILHRFNFKKKVLDLKFSPNDSQYFLTTSKDMNAKMYSLHSLEDFVPITLSGHRNIVISAFFSNDQETVYTVSKDGTIFVWKDPDSEKMQNDDDLPENMQQALKRTRIDIESNTRKRKYRRWWVTQREYFNQIKVQCANFHIQNNLLVVGFTSGIFGLYKLPDFKNIHTLR